MWPAVISIPVYLIPVISLVVLDELEHQEGSCVEYLNIIIVMFINKYIAVENLLIDIIK